MSKIKKMNILNFGSYKNFEWDKSISKDFIFKDINIIYGRNYSGKTTLSKIFQCIENKKLNSDYENIKFNFTLDDNTVINSCSLDELNNNVCVYNTDFVKKNLNWLHNKDDSIKPFTVLGKNNNDIETKIDNRKDKLKNLKYSEETKKKDAEISKLYQKSIDDLDKKLRIKARKIKEENSLYGDINYNITEIKKDINLVSDKNLERLNDFLIKEYKQIVEETKKGDIELLKNQEINFEKSRLEVNKILNKKIKPSEPIQDLLDDSILQEWVRNGKKYHENKRDTCVFCGAIINEQLWNKLDKHFSKESEELRIEIKEKIDNLEKSKKILDNLINIDRDDFYIQSKDNIKTLLSEWKSLRLLYINNIDNLIDGLNKKDKDIFNIITINYGDDLSNDILEIIKNINNLIESHNSKTRTLDKSQKEVKEKLRQNEILNFLDDIYYYNEQKNIKELENKENIIKTKNSKRDVEVTKVEEEIRKLETKLNDESRGAELVNEYLEKYFGYNDFKLVTQDGDIGVKYQIIRDGKEAKNLSEGECSLISFCYYMANIKDKLSHNNNLILYIDDPISSLDNNHIFFMFSLIESIITKPKNYKQLFISTHNLEFLKYLKRLTSSKKNLNHFIVEMEVKQNDRRSTLKLMPNHLRDFTTEFNYLFNEIYSLYEKVGGNRANKIKNTYNQFYNIPNNIRKFLEYYLFYKYPNNCSPLDNLDKLFDGDEATLLNRVINEHSHLTFIDKGWSPIDIPEIEGCVKIVIEKIKFKDKEQFDALLDSIKI